MDQLDRITMRPDQMGGRPCIRNMRVTVGMIVEKIGAIVIDAINLAKDQLATGALMTIDAARMRVTALPIDVRR